MTQTNNEFCPWKVLGIDVNIFGSVENSRTLQPEAHRLGVLRLVRFHVKIVIDLDEVCHIRNMFHAKFALVDVRLVRSVEVILQEGRAGFGKGDDREVEHPGDVADDRPVPREQVLQGRQRRTWPCALGAMSRAEPSQFQRRPSRPLRPRTRPPGQKE